MIPVQPKRRRNDLSLARRISLVLLGDPRPVIMAEALIYLCMGIWLINPWQNTFESSATYQAMALIAGEHIWAGFFIFLAVALIWAAIDYRYHTARQWVVFWGALVWVFLAAAFIYSNSAAMGTGAFVSNTIILAWAFVRMKFHG